jgi:hypothetical protein
MQVWKDKTPIRNLEVGWVSSVGIAIRNGLDGPGVELQWGKGRDFDLYMS